MNKEDIVYNHPLFLGGGEFQQNGAYTSKVADLSKTLRSVYEEANCHYCDMML